MPLRSRSEWRSRRLQVLGCKVKGNTLKRYHKSLRAFLDWLSEHRWQRTHGPINSRCALDNALCDFCVDMFLTCRSRGTRQLCVEAKCAVSLYLGQKVLPLTANALIAWDKQVSTTSRTPLPYGVFLCIVKMAASLYGMHLACSLVITYFGYLRARELLSLTLQDVKLPGDLGLGSSPSAQHFAGVHIRSSKTGKNQFVHLAHPLAVWALQWLCSHPSGERLLDGYSYHLLAKSLRCILLTLGLEHLRITLHSFRHGGALHDYISGVPFADIQDRGRWQSAVTLKIYLQTSKAIQLALDLPPSVVKLSTILARKPLRIFD